MSEQHSEKKITSQLDEVRELEMPSNDQGHGQSYIDMNVKKKMPVTFGQV